MTVRMEPASCAYGSDNFWTQSCSLFCYACIIAQRSNDEVHAPSSKIPLHLNQQNAECKPAQSAMNHSTRLMKATGFCKFYTTYAWWAPCQNWLLYHQSVPTLACYRQCRGLVPQAGNCEWRRHRLGLAGQQLMQPHCSQSYGPQRPACAMPLLFGSCSSNLWRLPQPPLHCLVSPSLHLFNAPY